MPISDLYLVLGGARSGKSRHAEALVEAMPPPWRYIATAEPLDEEMRVRIEAHKARRGTEWQTVEAPLDLASALEEPVPDGTPALVDCLTLWLGNLMLNGRPVEAGSTMDFWRRWSGAAGAPCWFPTKSVWGSSRTTGWPVTSATPRARCTARLPRAPNMCTSWWPGSP